MMKDGHNYHHNVLMISDVKGWPVAQSLVSPGDVTQLLISVVTNYPKKNKVVTKSSHFTFDSMVMVIKTEF